MRKVLSNLEKADRDLREYSYTRYNVRRQYDSDGTLKSEHTILAHRKFLEGFGFTQQVRRDGKPVPADELEREKDAFLDHVAELKAMSPTERRAEEAAERDKIREKYGWLKEFPEALDYRLVGEEMVQGRNAVVLECSPRPGYKASTLRARIFEKVRGRLWVDPADFQLIRVDVEVFDNINFGWGVLGKIQKGTHFRLDQHRLEDGSWLPTSQSVRFTARVLLFKTVAEEEITEYSEFRRNRAYTAGSGKPGTENRNTP